MTLEKEIQKTQTERDISLTNYEELEAELIQLDIELNVFTNKKLELAKNDSVQIRDKIIKLEENIEIVKKATRRKK